MSKSNGLLKKKRILYAAGPGDVIGTYQYWRNSQDDPRQTGLTYSGQFYSLCQALDADGYIISSNSQKDIVKDSQFIIENRPKGNSKSAISYYWNSIIYGLGLIQTALSWRASAVVVSSGTSEWFLFLILQALGIQVIPSLHCVLWPKYQKLSKTGQLLRFLDAFLFRRTKILSASQDITEQVKSSSKKNNLNLFEFLPVYRPETFSAIKLKVMDSGIFRITYIGRIEEDKGLFDLLEIARQLYAEGERGIYFDICGTGSALEELQKHVQISNLNDRFILHGHCNRLQLIEIINNSHAIIVPTKTSFVEGMNQVVIEGILSERPVITSTVCPAVLYVKEAIFEVPPDNVSAYKEAILCLTKDLDLYSKLQQNCKQYHEQFYDLSNSWAYALYKSLQESITPEEGEKLFHCMQTLDLLKS